MMTLAIHLPFIFCGVELEQLNLFCIPIQLSFSLNNCLYARSVRYRNFHIQKRNLVDLTMDHQQNLDGEVKLETQTQVGNNNYIINGENYKNSILLTGNTRDIQRVLFKV